MEMGKILRYLLSDPLLFSYQVTRAIDEHFCHLTPFQKVTLRVNGMTLRERITYDRANLPKGKRMGVNYWRDLAQEYVMQSDPVAELCPSAASVPISENLLVATATMHNKNPAVRSLDPISGFLRVCDSLNEVELIGLFKCLTAPMPF